MHRRYIWEVIGLQSARGRLCFFAIASVIIYVLPVHVLKGFSLWAHLGIPAPSIGLTRSYHSLLHGDLAMAWQFNKLIIVILIIGLPLLLKDASDTIRTIISKKEKR